MELSDEITIAQPRDKVYAALNDTEILKRSIPGCESLERLSDTEMEGTVQVKIGPVRAKFKGQVTLSDLDPPNGYTISGEGKGGAAGFAKGGAKVMLSDTDDGGTLLTYEAKADVGGKLAQIGSRLVEGSAKKLAGEFFDSLEGNMADVATEGAADAGLGAPDPSNDLSATTPAAPTEASSGGSGTTLGLWIAFGVIAAALIWALGFR